MNFINLIKNGNFSIFNDTTKFEDWVSLAPLFVDKNTTNFVSSPQSCRLTFNININAIPNIRQQIFNIIPNRVYKLSFYHLTDSFEESIETKVPVIYIIIRSELPLSSKSSRTNIRYMIQSPLVNPRGPFKYEEITFISQTTSLYIDFRINSVDFQEFPRIQTTSIDNVSLIQCG